MRINFNEVSIKAVFKYKDSNGKRCQETKKFYQTLNPYNLNGWGLPKERSQIMEELYVERDQWINQMTINTNP